MSKFPPCPFAFAKDFLRAVGTFQGNPNLEADVDIQNASVWVAQEFEGLTGIRFTEIMAAMRRLARDESLEGWPDRPEAGGYGEGRQDLRHIAEPMLKLGADGRLANLWRQFYWEWPKFAKALVTGLLEAGAPGMATGRDADALPAEANGQPAGDGVPAPPAGAGKATPAPTEGAGDDDAKNGPTREGYFYFGGAPHDFATLQWRLLKALFGKGSVPIESIATEVYQDKEGIETRLKKLVSDTGVKLLKHKLPYEIKSPMAGHYELKKIPPVTPGVTRK